MLIDGKDQVTKERGGDVLFFKTSAHVKVMEASSNAYPGAKLYRRTSAVIDHGGGRSYVRKMLARLDDVRVNAPVRRVVRNAEGAPELVITGRALELAADLGVQRWKLTMTHTATMAEAIAVAL